MASNVDLRQRNDEIEQAQVKLMKSVKSREKRKCHVEGSVGIYIFGSLKRVNVRNTR